MSGKKRSSDSPDDLLSAPETGSAPAAAAQAEAAKQHPDVEVREEGGKLVYSARGVDLLEREPGSNLYTLLVDCPATGARAGQRKVLTEPLDEQCACTARDLANAL